MSRPFVLACLVVSLAACSKAVPQPGVAPIREEQVVQGSGTEVDLVDRRGNKIAVITSSGDLVMRGKVKLLP